MTPAKKLADVIRQAGAKGEPALVAFMTAGFPSAANFREHLTAVASAADVVEIGVPFTDPMADGMTIQRSSQAALKQGVSLQWILQELRAMQRPVAPLVLMSYLNPLLQYGYEKLAADALNAGVCGFIVPDLPFDEGADESGHGCKLGSEEWDENRPDHCRVGVGGTLRFFGASGSMLRPRTSISAAS